MPRTHPNVKKVKIVKKYVRIYIPPLLVPRYPFYFKSYVVNLLEAEKNNTEKKSRLLPAMLCDSINFFLDKDSFLRACDALENFENIRS